MSSSFEKSVKGGTKIKLAAPKSKYVEHILMATHAGEAGVAEIFRTLQHRLGDSTWTIVFKALIIVHLMVRDGEPNVTLRYLAESSRRLMVTNFADAQIQGANIRRYSNYLAERAASYREIKVDYVRGGEGRLKRLSVEKGLLRETECVQDQIAALVKCDFFATDPENEITLTAFRLVTMDLLALYSVMNEGTINVLEHYFEMSKYDAERALKIYKRFSKQTDLVVQFLSLARQYEHSTRLEIPKLKHAPTGLTQSLQEYVEDPDFELNRRQYLAQQDAKKSGKSTNSQTMSSAESKAAAAADSSFPEPKSTVSSQAKGPAPDLIDFFESIQSNQQAMAQQTQMFQQTPQQQPFTQPPFLQQPTGFLMQQQPPQQQIPQIFAPQSTNPFGPITQPQPQTLQPDFTGAGFGGYGPQPIQQPPPVPFFPQPTGFGSIPENGVASFAPSQQQQPIQQQLSGPASTNPFRKSILPTSTATPLQRQSTNPFAKHTSPSSFSSAGSSFSQPRPQTAGPLQSSRTGTNPFAHSTFAPAPAQMLQPMPTGSTNPFRQSMMQPQQTGTLGGFSVDAMPTLSVFPKQGQPAGAGVQPWQ